MALQLAILTLGFLLGAAGLLSCVYRNSISSSLSGHFQERIINNVLDRVQGTEVHHALCFGGGAGLGLSSSGGKRVCVMFLHG